MSQYSKPNHSECSYCLCTLAVGQRYRVHAQQLAADLQHHAPDIEFLILTDRPDDFGRSPNVCAVFHRLQSVEGYHDKRFVLQKALARFDACLFLDADVRVLSALPKNMDFPEGLVARYGCSLIKHNTQPKVRPALRIIEAIAQAQNIELEKALWFHEFMFSFRGQAGKEALFFQQCQQIADSFERAGIYNGAANVMGLAAASAGFDISFHRDDLFKCFKDNIQKEKIKAGVAAPDDMAAEFENHRRIEYPARSLWQRIGHRLSKEAGVLYRLAKLRVRTLKQQKPKM